MDVPLLSELNEYSALTLGSEFGICEPRPLRDIEKLFFTLDRSGTLHKIYFFKF